MRVSAVSILVISIMTAVGGEDIALGATDVPIHENKSLDVGQRCPASNVFGLKAGGDGFLSVRSGPDSHYREIDRLHNGDRVFVVEERSPWLGIYYGVQEVACNSNAGSGAGSPKAGWVNRKWIEAD